MTNLIIDISNITHNARHSIKKSEEYSKGLVIHKTLTNIWYAYKKYDVSGIMVACDNSNVWRRELYPEYKGNREKVRDEYYKETREVIEELKDFFNECTSIPALQAPRAEADDIIAIAINRTKEVSPNQKIVIMSDDRDFMQLVDDNVRLYSPMIRKERVPEEKDFELFVKCIRGDIGDNILSAYPYVRLDRLRRAWEDKIEMLNLMETVTKEGIKVGEAYKLNRTLIDLDYIPDDIREGIDAVYDDMIVNGNHGKFDVIKTNRFYFQYDLKHLDNNLNKFRSMYRSTYQTNKKAA